MFVVFVTILLCSVVDHQGVFRLYCIHMLVKGYLRYKMTISRKMYLLAHRLRIFLFCRNVMYRSQDIQVFDDLTINQIRYIMMTNSTCCKMRFFIYLLKHNSLSHQTWLIGSFKQGQ